MEMKRKRTTGIVLCVIGGILLFFALMLGGGFGVASIITNASLEVIEEELDDFIDDGAVKTEGIVIDRDDSETTISYYVEETGEEYQTEFDVSSSVYKKGTEVTVYYDPNIPRKCMSIEMQEEVLGVVGNVFMILGIVLGVIFFLIGGTLLIVGIVFYRKAKAAEKNIYERGF